MRFEPIAPDCRYFSPAKLRDWGRSRLGEAYSVAKLADLLGWSKTGTRYALKGHTSPTLEGYVSALAKNGVADFTIWLDHVVADRD